MALPPVVVGDGERHSPWNNPKELLTPTIDRLKNWNDVDENLGDHILYLAKAASFFSPEDIPQEVLEGLWDQCFENKVIEWDGGTRKALTKILALKELKAHHLLTGDNGTLKMHRLVRVVLQKPELLPVDEKVDVLQKMVKYLDASLKERSLPDGLLKAWCGWADAALEIEELQTNEEFLFTIRALADQCQDVDLYRDAEILLQKILNLTGWERLSDELRAAVLNTFAVLHHDLNRFKEAEKEYRSALKIYEQLAVENPAKYNADLASVLNNFVILLRKTNRLADAISEVKRVLALYERLAGENPDGYGSHLEKIRDLLDSLQE